LIASGVYGPIEREVVFPMAGPIPAIGLYEPNVDPGQPFFRWTGPQRDLAFELPLRPEKRYILDVSAYFPRDVGRLGVSVNGVPTGFTRTPPEGVDARITIPIQPDPAHVITTISLRCEKVSLADATDSRIVGFIVTGMAVRPV
jgi:hypothetical protein